MLEFTCSKCGKRVQGDECPHCRAATAIATPEHAEQAKVTPPVSNDGAIREGEPPLHHARAPSIRKEVPHIFMRMAPFFVVIAIVALLVALLVPAVQKVREAEVRTQTINNFKSIALACHGYHDAYKVFAMPIMMVAEDGNKREVQLSWRVSIVPFIESSPLFNQIDRTVGWNHANNVRFQNLPMPYYTSPYRNPEEPAGLTRFQYFTGPHTLFPENAPVKLPDIKDGASRTFLFAEAEQPVIWTKPADMVIRPDRPLPLPEDRFLAAMVDGTVRMISRDKTTDTIIRQLINPNDQKPEPGWDN